MCFANRDNLPPSCELFYFFQINLKFPSCLTSPPSPTPPSQTHQLISSLLMCKSTSVDVTPKTTSSNENKQGSGNRWSLGYDFVHFKIISGVGKTIGDVNSLYEFIIITWVLSLKRKEKKKFLFFLHANNEQKNAIKF